MLIHNKNTFPSNDFTYINVKAGIQLCGLTIIYHLKRIIQQLLQLKLFVI